MESPNTSYYGLKTIDILQHYILLQKGEALAYPEAHISRGIYTT